MNLYEDAALEQTLDQISDQLGLLVLDLLLAGVQKARGQAQIYQELAEVQAETANQGRPF